MRDKTAKGYDTSGLTWTGHLDLSKPKITNFRIVSGMPDYVERQVNTCLGCGWDVNGPLMIMRFDGKDILVQNMVKYDKTS